MARKATKTTYAIDNSSGVEIRRRVVAGQMVPNAYQMEEGTYEDVESGVQSFGPTEVASDTPASPEPEAEQSEPKPASKPSSRRKKSGDGS